MPVPQKVQYFLWMYFFTTVSWVWFYCIKSLLLNLTEMQHCHRQSLGRAFIKSELMVCFIVKLIPVHISDYKSSYCEQYKSSTSPNSGIFSRSTHNSMVKKYNSITLKHATKWVMHWVWWVESWTHLFFN